MPEERVEMSFRVWNRGKGALKRRPYGRKAGKMPALRGDRIQARAAFA